MPQSLSLSLPRLKTPTMESAEAIALKENVMNASAVLPEMRLTLLKLAANGPVGAKQPVSASSKKRAKATRMLCTQKTTLMAHTMSGFSKSMTSTGMLATVATLLVPSKPTSLAQKTSTAGVETPGDSGQLPACADSD